MYLTFLTERESFRSQNRKKEIKIRQARNWTECIKRISIVKIQDMKESYNTGLKIKLMSTTIFWMTKKGNKSEIKIQIPEKYRADSPVG